MRPQDFFTIDDTWRKSVAIVIHSYCKRGTVPRQWAVCCNHHTAPAKAGFVCYSMLPGGSKGLIHSELNCNFSEILHALDIDGLRMFSWAELLWAYVKLQPRLVPSVIVHFQKVRRVWSTSNWSTISIWLRRFSCVEPIWTDVKFHPRLLSSACVEIALQAVFPMLYQ